MAIITTPTYHILISCVMEIWTYLNGFITLLFIPSNMCRLIEEFVYLICWWYFLVFDSLWTEVFSRNIDKLVKPKFGPGLPGMNEIERRTAVTLVNTNPAFDHLAPLPENVIPVGGLHIRDSKPLPNVRWFHFYAIFLYSVSEFHA